MSVVTQRVERDRNPTPAPGSVLGGRSYGTSFVPRQRRRSRALRALTALAALVLLVSAVGSAAFAFGLFPHGQRAQELNFHEAFDVGLDTRRSTSELTNSDIAAFRHVVRFKERLEFLATQPGLRGDNARELLKKLRR